jgi:hypothetical protein
MARPPPSAGALLLLFVASCGAPDAAPREGGFFIPDQGRLIGLSRGGDPPPTTLIVPPAAADAALDAARLVAPLIVIDVRERALKAPDFVFAAEDLAEFEARRGPIPYGALVVLATGAVGPRAHPGFAPAVVERLCRERGAVGIGSDAVSIDATAGGGDVARDAALAAGRYVLTGLDRLDQVAGGRAIGFVGAPLAPGPQAPVRVVALVPRRAAQVSR